MKAPSWNQQILFVTDDPEVKLRGLSAFGKESLCVVVKDATEAIARLDQGAFDVFIIDEKALADHAGNFPVSFVELTQYANQLNQGLTIVVLVNKLLSLAGDFARKSGATLIMDRKDFSVDRMIYVIRVMRKRTFRTILWEDLDRLRIDELSVDVYHYLPLSDRYAVMFPKNEPFSEERREKLNAAGISHLFAQGADFNCVIQSLQEKSDEVGGDKPILSRDLSLIREHFKQSLIQLFDISTDGNVHSGKLLYDQMLELVNQLEALVFSYSDLRQCLERLPYPRWSTLAHGINSAIYALVFAKICKLENVHQITVAALYHNIGISEVAQSVLKKPEHEMTMEERNSYALHVRASLEILKRKRVALPKATELAIFHHHEHYNGLGYPQGLRGETISPAGRLLSIVGSFDYFVSVKPKEHRKSSHEAWQEFMKMQEPGQFLYSKFDSTFIASLSEFFSGV